MRILKRDVLTSKSVAEVKVILMSSAYSREKAKFEENSFSIQCAKRHNGRYLWLVPVKGCVDECNGKTRIAIEIHADINWFIGGVIALSGLVGLLFSLAFSTNRWIPQLGTILLGLIIAGETWWKGFEVLDLLEHKLTRRDG